MLILFNDYTDTQTIQKKEEIEQNVNKYIGSFKQTFIAFNAPAIQTSTMLKLVCHLMAILGHYQVSQLRLVIVFLTQNSN